MAKLSAITGKQLIKLLSNDGWVAGRRAKHGLALSKAFGDRTRVTVVPNTSESLDPGTLGAILGPKQTNIGKKGLKELIEEHGS